MPWADPHCHLYDSRVGPLDAVLDACHDAGVDRVITVGCDLQTTRDAVRDALAGAARGVDVWATAGVHPHEAQHGVAFLDDYLATQGLRAEHRVVAVGEAGLDYYYDHSPREVQREVFAHQVRLANELGLPLVIHTRDAWDDTFAILRSEGVPVTTVFHCFTGGPGEAQTCLSLHDGVILSYSGIITFPNAEPLRDALRLTPLDRLTVETDSPYLAPIPHRGRSNRPSYVVAVGEKVAEIKGVDVSEVRDATWATTARTYRLPE